MRNLVYLLGRSLAVLTRPLCLYGINNYLAQEASEGVATVFLIGAFSMACISADPHRRFYKSFFSDQSTNTSFSFYSYLINLFSLSTLGCILAFFLMQRSSNSLLLAATCIPYFISEKLADEVLRFKLFERDLYRWGLLTAARSSFQILGLLMVIGIFQTKTPSWVIILTFSIASLLVMVRELPHNFLNILNLSNLKILLSIIPRAIKILCRDWILWAMTVVASGIVYIDRFVVLFIDKSTLPIYSLVIMCFSLVPLSVDFFYFSRHRRDFLEHKIAIKQALLSPYFKKNLVFAIVVASIATLFVLHSSTNGYLFPVLFIFTIALNNICVATLVLPQEILYWHHCLREIFLIDLSFWILSSFVLLLGWQFHFSVNIILVALVCSSLVRVSLYIYRAMKISYIQV